MRLTTKLISVLILLLLVFSLILMKGCGKTLNGGACGGCPDTTAPAGSTITGPVDATYTVSSATGATTAGPFCVNSMIFIIKDTSGSPLDDICVEVFTNGFVALASADGDCTDNPDYTTYIRTRTDNGGTITVDLATDVISKPTGSTTTSTVSNFVQVNSCSASAIWKGTWTVTWN